MCLAAPEEWQDGEVIRDISISSGRVWKIGRAHAYVVTERIEGIQVSPARLQLGSSALGDRAGEAERPLTLSGTPRPVGPPHSCQARLCSWGSAHPQQGWQTTLNRVRFNI